jgi:hypothetical protein
VIYDIDDRSRSASERCTLSVMWDRPRLQSMKTKNENEVTQIIWDAPLRRALYLNDVRPFYPIHSVKFFVHKQNDCGNLMCLLHLM